MQQERVQRVVSEDGTGIVARVAGQGPPLVLLPAGPGDSDTSWDPLLPWLSERFTCYLLDTRAGVTQLVGVRVVDRGRRGVCDLDLVSWVEEA